MNKTTMKKIVRLIGTKLDEQESDGFVGETQVNTTRVVKKLKEYEHSRGKQDMTFGAVEFIQNAADFVRELLNESAKNNKTRAGKVVCGDNKIEWFLDDVVVLGVYFLLTGVEIFQFGRPLPLNAIGSGTESKAASEDNSGGFGDGLKTGVLAFIRRMFEMQFIFRFYSDDNDRCLIWNWNKKVCDGFTDVHLVVDIGEEDCAVPEAAYTDLPTMTTRISCEESLAPALHEAFASALSRFSWLLYNQDFTCRSIYMKSCGAWCDSSSFSCNVSSVAGFSVSMPNGPLVEVGGIFYPMQGYCVAPRTFVVCVAGRGLPGDEYQIFNNQLREVNDSRLQRVFSRQFDSFFKNQDLREDLTSAFYPLLNGKESLLMSGGPGSLVRSLLYGSDKDRIRNIILYRKLFPRAWDPNCPENRKEVTRLVNSCVIVNEATESKARYLQWINKSGGVVVIDPHRASGHLFQCDMLSDMEENAAKASRESARKPSDKKCVPVDSDLRPAVDYIAGKKTKVVRVTMEPPDGIKAYSFRSADTVVYNQIPADGPWTVKELNCHFRTSNEESNRSTQFLLHFMSNRAEELCMEQRVKFAIRAAKNDDPYNLGEKPEKRKATLTDSESDDDMPSAKKIAKMIQDKQKQKPDVEPKKRVLLPNAVRSLEPQVGRLRIANSGSGSLGYQNAVPAPDPLPTKSLDQEWAADMGIFLPSDAMLDTPAGLASRMDTFNKAVDLVREAVNTGRCQIFASWSPDADWLGLHYDSDGLCLINVAMQEDMHDMIMTIVHEVSHEYASRHDINFVTELQENTKAVMKHMLERMH